MKTFGFIWVFRLLVAGLVVVFAVLFATQSHAQTTKQTAQNSAQQSERFGIFADQIDYDEDAQTLTAKGNVIVQFENESLYTDHIIFNSQTQELILPTSFEVITADKTLIKGENGRYNRETLSGLFTNAEILLDNNFQLITHQLVRRDGRYKVLDKNIASACYVCKDTSVPFWAIRSSQLIHDEQRRRLLFKDPILSILGVPVFYMPRLQTPDPTVNRATGVLVPTLIQSNTIGTGLEAPYYIVSGNHSDVTLTPKLTTNKEGTNFVIAGEYRQNYSNGQTVLGGAVAVNDTLSDKPWRNYIYARGGFALPDDYYLNFNIHVTNENRFKRDFNYGGEDRLDNSLTLQRSRNRAYVFYRISSIQSLRDIPVAEQIPLVFPEVYYHKIIAPAIATGRVQYKLHSTTLLRENSRRVTLSGAEVYWHNDWKTRGGFVAELDGQINANYFAYSTDYSDANDFDNAYSVVPLGALTLRYPFVRKRLRKTGEHKTVTHSVEPIVQLVSAPYREPNTPVEDSTQAELEDDSLFSTDRFDGFDRTERGNRVNFGVRYVRYRPEGWQWNATLGRIYRLQDLGQFPDAFFTARGGQLSDYISGLAFSYQNRFFITNQLLFDRNFDFSKTETNVRLRWQRVNLTTTYVRLSEDAIPNSNQAQHEVRATGYYDVTQYWGVNAGIRQNLEARELVRATAGIQFRNECARFSFTFSLADTGQNRLTREYGFKISLVGFGAGKINAAFSKKCARVALETYNDG
ncbi:MAG: LPS-assembly protein LptD [Candidatus Halichondribacter symbioticus]